MSKKINILLLGLVIAYATHLPAAPSVDQLSELDLNQMDIAQMNLICAQGLPGTENLDIEAALKEIDQVTAYVAQQTAAYAHLYERNPA